MTRLNAEIYYLKTAIFNYCFSAMLMPGVPPAGLFISSSVLIPKSKVALNFDNYRQIAISNVTAIHLFS